LAQEGKEYVGYEKGVSFGEGAVDDPTRGKTVVKYKLQVLDGEKPRKVKLTLVAEYESKYENARCSFVCVRASILVRGVGFRTGSANGAASFI
jgi:hypothetical protein